MNVRVVCFHRREGTGRMSSPGCKQTVEAAPVSAGLVQLCAQRKAPCQADREGWKQYPQYFGPLVFVVVVVLCFMLRICVKAAGDAL